MKEFFEELVRNLKGILINVYQEIIFWIKKL